MANTATEPKPYWSQPPDTLMAALHSTPAGLATVEARQRLEQFGPNLLKARKKRR